MEKHKEEMNSDIVKDVEARIDFVVNRFRMNAGPDYYTYKLKYIDDIDINPIFFTGLILVICLVISGYLFHNHELWRLWIAIGSGVLITVIPVIIHVARGRILKEKDWRGDYVSDEDVLYLCENNALKKIIINELKDNIRHTYSRLYSRRDLYIAAAIKEGNLKRRKNLMSKING